MNTILRVQKVIGSSRNFLCKIQKTSFCCYERLHTPSVPVLRVIHAPSLSVSRNFWETFPGTRPLLQLKDRLDPENHEIVFRAKLFNYVFYAQLIAMSTLFTQTVYGLYYAYQAVYHQVGPALTHYAGMPVAYNSLSIAILMLFTVQNIMVYHFAQNSLLRVYHKIDTDEYVFVTLNANPFKSRLTYCKPGELTPIHRWGLLKFFGNFKIKERKFYFNYINFFDISHFNRLLSEHIKSE